MYLFWKTIICKNNVKIIPPVSIIYLLAWRANILNKGKQIDRVKVQENVPYRKIRFEFGFEPATFLTSQARRRRLNRLSHELAKFEREPFIYSTKSFSPQNTFQTLLFILCRLFIYLHSVFWNDKKTINLNHFINAAARCTCGRFGLWIKRRPPIWTKSRFSVGNT